MITGTACGAAWSPAIGQPVQRKLGIGPNGNVVEVGEFAARIDDPARLKEAFDRHVADLAGNDFAARQQASAALSGNEQFDLPMLESALMREGLTLEARTRIQTIARQRFFRTPRAALGFQFGGQLRDRVVVGQTFQKFPAFGRLEEGDMIVGADGYKLDGPGARAMLQSIIISHEPGETLNLIVRRGAKKVHLAIALGRFADLDQAGGGVLLEDRLSRAWRIRSGAKFGAGKEPIRVAGAPSAPWGVAAEVAQRREDKARMREAAEFTPRIAGGGMTRLLSNPDEARFFEPAARQQIMWQGGQMRFGNMPFMRGGFFGDANPDEGLPPMDPRVERGQLLELRMQTDRRAGGMDPATLPQDDPRRAELLESARQRALINKQIDALEAEADELRAAGKDAGKHSAADANPPANP